MSLTDDVVVLLGDLADMSGRWRRGEPVDEAEVDEFKRRKEAVIEAIDPGHYERKGFRL